MNTTLKGLPVTVLRPATNYDCTLNGITSKVDSILLIDPQLNGIFDIKQDETYLTLIRRQIRHNEPEYIHAVPTVNGVPQLGGMFGGNFVTCSDSRISALNRYPIPVHDRFENQ